MADNVDFTPGTGATGATDDIGGVHYPRVKLSLGDNGTAVDAAGGAGNVGTNTMRVVLASDTVNANGRAAAAASAPTVLSNEDKTALDAAVTAMQALGTGLSVFRSLDLDESEEEVKGTAGKLWKLRIANLTTSVKYVKLYNATAANVTVGTTTPIDTIVVPAAAASDACVITETFGGKGLTFSTALCLAATTGLADNNSGAPGANEVVVTAYYE